VRHFEDSFGARADQGEEAPGSTRLFFESDGGEVGLTEPNPGWRGAKNALLIRLGLGALMVR